MNDKKRKQIYVIINRLQELSTELNAIARTILMCSVDEHAKLESLPENLENSSRYEALEQSSEALEEASEEINLVYDNITEALSHLINTTDALEESL